MTKCYSLVGQCDLSILRETMWLILCYENGFGPGNVTNNCPEFGCVELCRELLEKAAQDVDKRMHVLKGRCEKKCEGM